LKKFEGPDNGGSKTSDSFRFEKYVHSVHSNFIVHIPMLRRRDMVATLVAIILARMAWNDNMDSLSAGTHLAFYLERDKALAVSPVDVDGDGTSEALCVVKSLTASTWVLQVLDLKPLHHVDKTRIAPFQPKVLFSSQDIKEEGAIPLRTTSGQILARDDQAKQPKLVPISAADKEYNERTRHYFCGTDWHDASSKCGTPCPGGQPSECPDNERCYADTSCDALAPKSSHLEIQSNFHLTPAGGLPSIVTLWSNGVLSLHSITTDKPAADDAKSDKPRSIGGTKALDLRQMWRVELLRNMSKSEDIQWKETSIRFMDSFESEEVGANHGMVIVAGSYVKNKEENIEDDGGGVSFMVAVDAWTGSSLWDTFSEDKKPELLLPMQRGTTSAARRRSRVPALHQDLSPPVTVNCLVSYKKSMKDALPYAYWSAKDAGLMPIHLEQKTRNAEQTRQEKTHEGKKVGHEHHQHQPKPVPPSKDKAMWRHQFHQRQNRLTAINGRPNAIVMHSKGGLQIRSLKNGRTMCHLSLLEGTLYGDLNNDGIVDQVQVLLDSSYKEKTPSNKWMNNLITKATREHQELKEKGAKSQLQNSSPNLCHALATSGIPAKEELFTSSLCGTASERVGDHPAVSLGAVAPIVVESFLRRGVRDVIVALNNRMVHRLHGRSGRVEWKLIGKHHKDFPTWETMWRHRLGPFF
jgi:hypothetical protein